MNLVSRTASYSFLPLLVLKYVSQTPFTYSHPNNVSIEHSGSCLMLQGIPPTYIRICGYGQIYLFVYNTLICVCLCE